MEIQPPKPEKLVKITKDELKDYIALKEREFELFNNHSVMPANVKLKRELQIKRLKNLL